MSCSFCFVSVEFNGGERESDSRNDTCRRSFFLLFDYFVCSLISLPTGLMPVSSCSSCSFYPCNRHLFLFSTYVVVLEAFPFRSSCIFRTPVVCFALFSCFFSLFFLFFLIFVWSGLFGCGLVPEIYDRPGVRLRLKVRLLQAQVIKTLLYGCMT